MPSSPFALHVLLEAYNIETANGVFSDAEYGIYHGTLYSQTVDGSTVHA